MMLLAGQLLSLQIKQQAEQLNGFWLITIETTTDLTPAIGSCFYQFNQQNQLDTQSQAWLLEAKAKQLTLLANQAWLDAPTAVFYPAEISEQASQNSANNQLWLGENLTQACVIDAAKRANQQANSAQLLALLAAETGFAFPIKPAKFMLDLLPEAIGASALLEDLQLPNRLATTEFTPGCYQGELVDLYQAWLHKYLANKPDQHWVIKGFLSSESYQACLAASENFKNLSWQVKISQHSAENIQFS